MRDGRTRKRATKDGTAHQDLRTLLERQRPSIVVVRGRAAGLERVLDRELLTIGRGPGVDLAIDDEQMSRQHAAVEFVGGRFRVRDLGSTNGVEVGGRAVQVAPLAAGDRFQIGCQEFQLVVVEVEVQPDVYDLTEA